MTTEIKLLEAARQGDTAAFGRIIEKYQSTICAITFCGTGRIDISEELAQETFLSAWKNLHQLTELSGFRAWLFTIARNMLNSYYKKKSPEPLDPTHIVNISSNAPTQTDNLIDKEEKAILQKAIMEIPAEYREPLVMYYRHGKSTKQVAQTLGLNESTLRTRLQRARQILREHVAKKLEQTIENTGPGKAFTNTVLAAIGLTAVGTASSASAATAASTQSTTTAIAAVMTTTAAKISVAAAVLIVTAGAVFAYKQINQPQTDALTAQPAAASAVVINRPIAAANTASPQPPAPEPTAAAQSIDLQADDQAHQTQIEFVDTAPTANPEPAYQEPISSIQNITIPIDPTQSPLSQSPYNYFIFKELISGQKTVRLALAEITNQGFRLSDIGHMSLSQNNTYEYIDVIDGTLYAINKGSLLYLDLNSPDNKTFQTIDFDLEYSYDYADGKIYGSTRDSDRKRKFRIIDLKNKSFKDIDIPEGVADFVYAREQFRISPDRSKLAFYAYENMFFTLKTFDLETHQITQAEESIRWHEPHRSYSTDSPPFCWLDDQTILTVCGNIKKRLIGGMDRIVVVGGKAVNSLAIINIITGKADEITPMPPDEFRFFLPQLIQDNVPPGPRVNMFNTATDMTPDSPNGTLGNYRLDVSSGKLIEEDCIGGDYLVIDSSLFLNQNLLGSVSTSDYYKVSPDNKRIFWVYDAKLFVNDCASAKVHTLSKGYRTWGILFWLTDENMYQRDSRYIPTDWTAFEDYTPEAAEQKPTPKAAKIPIKEALSFTVTTDKNEYLIHEPAIVTITLTNNSQDEIQIFRPFISDSQIDSAVGMSLAYPGVSTSVDSFSAHSNQENIKTLIVPGQSFTDTAPLEVSVPGEYRLSFGYKGCQDSRYTGQISATVSFEVLPVNDKFEEMRLFETKIERLTKQFYDEYKLSPDFKGYNRAVTSNLSGFPGMGTRAIPYLMKIIDNETNQKARDILLKALIKIANAETIPYLRQQIQPGQSKIVCQWIYNLYRKSLKDNTAAADQALEALLAAMQHESVEVRRDAVKNLIRIYSPKVTDCFMTAVDDLDSQVQVSAARYLAAAEMLNLYDWILLAMDQPTYERYIAAKAIISDLQNQWQISTGTIPELTKQDCMDDTPAVDEFVNALSTWIPWTNENVRLSIHFFEKDRKDWILD